MGDGNFYLSKALLKMAGGDVGDASPHQPFSTMLWINKIFP